MSNQNKTKKIVPSNVLGSASAMATTGNDSWSTPMQQYKGFKPLIDALSGKNRLKIWDPFYFNGTAAEYMAQVFNSDIIHEDRKVDLVPFQLPAFAQNTDMIFTNPPFSIAKKVLVWMLSLGIPFIACLPVAVATNKRTNPLIRQHKIQIIRSNGRIAFELSGSPEDSSKKTGTRDTQWYCYGLSLPADVQYRYVGSLKGKMGDVLCLGNSNKKRKHHCQVARFNINNILAKSEYKVGSAQPITTSVIVSASMSKNGLLGTKRKSDRIEGPEEKNQKSGEKNRKHQKVDRPTFTYQQQKRDYKQTCDPLNTDQQKAFNHWYESTLNTVLEEPRAEIVLKDLWDHWKQTHNTKFIKKKQLIVAMESKGHPLATPKRRGNPIVFYDIAFFLTMQSS